MCSEKQDVISSVTVQVPPLAIAPLRRLHKVYLRGLDITVCTVRLETAVTTTTLSVFILYVYVCACVCVCVCMCV